MLLRRLVEYADRLDLPVTGYSPVAVRYAIGLFDDGRLLRSEPIDLRPAGAKRDEWWDLPFVQKTSGVRANLLNGNAEYTLGFARAGTKPERARACHAAYLALLRRCAERTNEPTVRAVLAFLEDDPLDKLALPADFAADATIVFRVSGQYPTDLDRVKAFWAEENDPAARNAPTMQCVACGELRPVVRVLDGKIKGVPGGQTAGTSVISANKAAFESYGLEQSLVAPICARCADLFTKALNALLRDPEHHVRLVSSVAVFWTRDPITFSLRRSIVQPDAGVLRGVFEAYESGKLPPAIRSTPFYAMVLSASGARTVVRDWIDTTLDVTIARLRDWYGAQWIVDPIGGEPRPFGPYALAAATVRDAKKDLNAATVRALLHAELAGTAPPVDLLAKALRRAHAGTTVVAGRTTDRLSHARVALIKLILAHHRETREEVRTLVMLNRTHPSTAYHCGRLLAVLEEIQEAAIRDVNATVVDRFFGAASTSPLSVYQRLLKGAFPHLSKLRRERGGLYRILNDRLDEIVGRIGDFPRVLTLPDQGLFALGFYHQRAFDRQQRREAKARRDAGMTVDDAEAALADLADASGNDLTATGDDATTDDGIAANDDAMNEEE